MSAESTAHVVDRTGWPSGPWDGEPDRKHWIDEATGLDCLIVRNHHGGLCGYVGVPQQHQWHGKGYDDIDAQVHGGLTYSDHCVGSICHAAEEAANEPVWWIGFDCVHSGDKSPSTDRYGRIRDDVYRDIGYVASECASLASQVAAAN